MDYRLALENAQRNVERQKLELEKANKAMQEKPSQPSSNSRTSSGFVDPAKIKQFMERRRQELEAKKAANSKFPPVSLPARSQPQHSADNKSKHRQPSDSSASASRSDSAPVQKRSSNNISNGSGVSDPKKSKPSVEGAQSSRLPQPPPPPPATAPILSGPAEMQRQYLMMRREELLKELEKIDKKLRKLTESNAKAAAPATAKQSMAKDRSALPSIKKIAQAPAAPPRQQVTQPHREQQQQHRKLSKYGNHEDRDDDDDDNDSFIDDTEEAGVDDYAKIVREVHRSLKFDPRRYAAVNPNDDCRGMVASYRDIQAEERRSKRIGVLEDAADIRDEVERRARREEKRKLKD